MLGIATISSPHYLGRINKQYGGRVTLYSVSLKTSPVKIKEWKHFRSHQTEMTIPLIPKSSPLPPLFSSRFLNFPSYFLPLDRPYSPFLSQCLSTNGIKLQQHASLIGTMLIWNTNLLSIFRSLEPSCWQI